MYGPHGNPPPRKSQGLYWLKLDDNLWSRDVVVCMNASELDPDMKTLMLPAGRYFIPKDSVIGNSAFVLANQQNSGAHYECTFDDDLGDETLSGCHFDFIVKGGLVKAEKAQFMKKHRLINMVLNTVFIVE